MISQLRRDPNLPHASFVRWVYDNSALLQYHDHRSALLIRYEDMSANDTSRRLATFGALFDFLALPRMDEAMRRRCCDVEHIAEVMNAPPPGGALNASQSSATRSSSSMCLEGISAVGVHHTADTKLRCDPTLSPLVHKVEGWRSNPGQIYTAQAMMRRVSIETPIGGRRVADARVEDSIVYRLARAFRYYEDDDLVKEALDWSSPLVSVNASNESSHAYAYA